MKKLLLIFSVAGALFLTSCGDNENTVNPQPLGTATVSGTVYAELDYTNDDYETVNNKKVIAVVYDMYSEGESYRILETSTDGNGNYSLQIEVGNRPVGVEIQLIDFRATVTHGDGSSEEIFYGDDFYTGVEGAVKGGEYIRDIYYND